MFRDCKEIRLPADSPPYLVVVVDAEEEFDWSAAPDSRENSVSAMEYIGRAQAIFREYGITPCYVIDYPVASQKEGFGLLKQYYDRGECDIGAQLHPWVNPPFKEALTRSNMYPGNLPRDLEKEKLSNLKDRIAESFGFQPTIYKAGRYGFGENTQEILAELGFTIDLSVCPPMDGSEDGGPDYSHFGPNPFWFGDPDRPLLEIPCTGAFLGWAASFGRPLHNVAWSLRQFRLPGVLARLGAVDRLMLSPEGYSSNEHLRLTKSLLERGTRVFTWSFHSPSVVPGNTTYVRNEAQLVEFLERFRRFFDFFFNEMGGKAISPTQLRVLAEQAEC